MLAVLSTFCVLYKHAAQFPTSAPGGRGNGIGLRTPL